MRIAHRLTCLFACLLFASMGHSENVLDKLKKALPQLPGTPTQSNVNRRQPPDRETLEPSSDRLCDSLERSYALSENLTELAANQVKCKIMKCRPDEMIPTDQRQLENWLRNYSKKRVWLPVPLESAIGETFLNEQQAQGVILERGLANNDKLYAKVDQALAAAKQSYPGVVYDLKIFVVDITDRVNAQASPGGYIFVTKAAAKDLADDALQLVVGHEVAHLAKRHMSKQLQQRLMETEQGVDLFKRVASVSKDTNQQTNTAKQIVDRLQCSFAKYEQAQETQADACSARAMIEAGGDPEAAWDEYLRVRGTVANTEPQTQDPKRSACFAALAAHPEERARETHLRHASSHHRRKAGR